MKVIIVGFCLLAIAITGGSLMLLAMSTVAKYKGNAPMALVVVAFMLLMLIIGMLGPMLNPEFFNLNQ